MLSVSLSVYFSLDKVTKDTLKKCVCFVLSSDLLLVCLLES